MYWLRIKTSSMQCTETDLGGLILFGVTQESLSQNQENEEVRTEYLTL